MQEIRAVFGFMTRFYSLHVSAPAGKKHPMWGRLLTRVNITKRRAAPPPRSLYVRTQAGAATLIIDKSLPIHRSISYLAVQTRQKRRFLIYNTKVYSSINLLYLSNPSFKQLITQLLVFILSCSLCVDRSAFVLPRPRRGDRAIARPTD